MYPVGVPKKTLLENHTSVPGKEIENVEQKTVEKHMKHHVFRRRFLFDILYFLPGCVRVIFENNVFSEHPHSTTLTTFVSMRHQVWPQHAQTNG